MTSLTQVINQLSLMVCYSSILVIGHIYLHQLGPLDGVSHDQSC
jgi:hypothetical protein